MKKIIALCFIVFLMFPSFSFASSINYNYNYEYNWKTYYIYYPENIEFFEREFLTWKLKEDHIYYNVVFLNILLIKKGLKPIY